MSEYRLIKAKQVFSSDEVRNIEEVTRGELHKTISGSLEGKKIAIAVGSRGINKLDVVVRATVSFLREKGAEPFIIPAMGSHGGATAKGQTNILHEFGIDEKMLNSPIDASMDVVQIDSKLECKLYMSKAAFESDGVILINRIKPHTDFHGSYESGLAKMSVIGLGKHAGALEIHSFGLQGLGCLIPVAAHSILATGKIMLGIGIVENAYDRIAHIEAVAHDQIMAREPELLAIARNNMPSLPVGNIDILIVDRLGKDISGVGMDPNIIGRTGIRGEIDPCTPSINQIIVADLTEKTQGNALGVGLADVITRRLFQKINFKTMYENAYTSTFLGRAKLPVIAETDKDAFRYARRVCERVPFEHLRIIRIRDTLHLGEIYISPAVYRDQSESTRIEVVSEPIPLFNGDQFSEF